MSQLIPSCQHFGELRAGEPVMWPPSHRIRSWSPRTGEKWAEQEVLIYFYFYGWSENPRHRSLIIKCFSMDFKEFISMFLLGQWVMLLLTLGPRMLKLFLWPPDICIYRVLKSIRIQRWGQCGDILGLLMTRKASMCSQDWPQITFR